MSSSVPADEDDLVRFMGTRPEGLPVTVLGVGSNVLVRDHGIAGVTIRLGRGFTGITVDGPEVHAGAAALDGHVARQAAAAGLAGLEFLAGVPGTLGGAIAMNAGAYGREIADVLVRVRAVARDGAVHDLDADELGHGYRHCELAGEWIFTSCVLRGEPGAKPEIEARIREIQDRRALTQPTKERTGGSTFRNPPPPQARAWELIDRAGCRGLRRGGAMGVGKALQLPRQHRRSIGGGSRDPGRGRAPARLGISGRVSRMGNPVSRAFSRRSVMIGERGVFRTRCGDVR